MVAMSSNAWWVAPSAPVVIPAWEATIFTLALLYATDTLIQLCKQVNEDVSKRELDLIMSCGEIISGTLLVNILKSKKINSILLTGAQAGIITNAKYGDSSVIDVNPCRIKEELQKNYDL